MKILVVDDMKMIRFCLGKLLDVVYPGCEITEACDEKQGVELIMNNPPFDLVLSDLDTPTENGGLLVIKAVKERIQSTPVILMTGGRTDEELMRLAQETGADGCLSKPFALGVMRTEIGRVLAKTCQPA